VVPDRGRLGDPREDAVLGKPLVGVEVVELLGPEQARERLAQDAGLVGAERGRGDGAVELVGLGLPRGHGPVEVRERIAHRAGPDVR
jgi:hypothetical protein